MMKNGHNHCEETETKPIQSEKFDEYDKYYYKSYENLDSHYTMLTDTVRTLAYKKAIDNMDSKLKGTTVIDVGSGTGILSLFMANAGAKKVYALEANSIACLSREFIKENDKEGTIDVIQTVAEEADLGDIKVDAIVSEWMGYCLVCENMLSSVLRVRDKYLKEDGIMFPCNARLLIAGAMNDDFKDNQEFVFWSDLSKKYQVNMSGSLYKSMMNSLVDNAVVANLSPDFLVTREDVVLEINLYKAKSEEVNNLEGTFELRSLGNTFMSHLVLWFLTKFPDGSVLSTSPTSEQTHWMQTLVKLPENFCMTKDSIVKGSIKFAPANSDKRRVSINVDLEFNKDGYSQPDINQPNDDTGERVKKMHFQSFL